MDITNLHDLPETLVSAVTSDYYSQDGHISATGLIQPPRIRQLTKRHNDNLVADVSDSIWRLLGSAVHDVLQRADTTDALQEERLSCMVHGWKVTGQADLWEAPGILSDYKVTSVYAVMGDVKLEWESQLNIYAHLYRQAGFPVSKLQIVAILRDWSRMTALFRNKDGKYPQCAATVVPVKLWPVDMVKEYLSCRITEHQDAEALSDSELPLCSPEERWEKPAKYAVMKKKGKRAVRLLDTQEEAEQWIADGKGDSVVFRPGESTRCIGYCACNIYCDFYQSIKDNEVK